MKPQTHHLQLPHGSKVWPALALALVCALGLARQTAAQSYALNSIWTVANGAANTHIATGDVNRGLAYSAVSNTVFVVNKSTPAIDVFNGTNGTYLGSANTGGTTGGNFILAQVGVGDDGVLYGANLSTAVSASSFYRIYRWTNYNTAPTAAYAGDATAGMSLPGNRIGDTFAVRGAGVNTLLLAGINPGGPYTPTTNVVLLSTLDGVNFNSKLVAISGLPSLSANGNSVNWGIGFYTNNTILFKPNGSTAYIVQYPANFASLPNPVPATVVGTVALSGGTVVSSVQPATGLTASYGSIVSAGSSSTTVPLNLYAVPPITGFAVPVASTTTPHPNVNGNYAGTVALGLYAGTNYIYTLDCNNGVDAFEVTVVPPQPPSISTQPVGGTGVYAPITLSVSAVGASPAYEWQATNAAMAGAFTNIPGATSSSYAVTAAPITNFYRVVITNTVGSVTSSVVLVQTIKAVTNSAVASLWTVAAGTTGYSYLTSASDGTRGIAYDTNTHRVVVSSTAGLYVLNGNNGTNIETLNGSGLTWGGLLSGPDQVGIADDGAVYAGNVVSAPSSFNLYRWSNPSNSVTASSAFSADPGNGQAGGERWGDTLAVRGAGPNTQILLGSRASGTAGTNVAFLTPNDGIGLTYASVIIAVSNVPPGFAAYGIAFGAGNTFWAKTAGGDLYEIAFDTNLLTGTVLYDYKQPSQIAGGLICAGVDPVNNIFASITESDTPHDLQLFQLTGTSDAPVLFQQSFFASANPNGNGNAVVCVKYPRIYALDVDNGIVAVTYGVPATTAPSISTPPASITAYTNVGSLTLSVGASGSLPLYFQWQYNSNNIPGATSSIYVITNTALKVGGYYDVVVRNVAGSVTSAPPALVTLIPPVTSPLVTPLWSIGPGTNGAWLTASGNETRGLAYDPNTTNLFVADHSNIHVYSGTNGSYLYDLNTAGIPSGGINGWTVDQVGVADDGTVYSANLSPDGTAFSIISYSPGGYSLNYAYGGSTGGSDLNSLDPAGDRWGDTMAVRGSGVNTEILFGSLNGTNVALFTTPDGQSFMPTLIAVQGGLTGGFAGLGIAFGTNNTFYAKGGHYFDLREVAFDPVAGTGIVLQDYLSGSAIPDNLTGIGVDVTNNILGGVCFDDSPNDAQLYLLSGNTNAPDLFNQDFFPASNPNGNYDAVTVLKGGLGFALDVNNGIVAFTYSLPAAPAVTLTSVAYLPHSVTITWNNTFDGHDYQVYYKNHLLDATWTLLGTVNATNATASYTDTTATGATRFYRVVSQ